MTANAATNHDPIAIVAMSAVYPDAPNLDAFAKNIFNGHDACRATDPDRWIIPPRDAVRTGGGPDHAFHDRACTIRDFTPQIDGLSIPQELIAKLDPMFQLVLHVGRDIWNVAKTSQLDPARVGVALAAIALPTDTSSAITREILGTKFESALREKLNGVSTLDTSPSTQTHPLNAGVVGVPAQLLRQALGLGGRAFTLDAACASSLYAIKIACDDLRAGRADAFIAGGVSRPESLYTQMGFTHLQALSRTGLCRPFDANADGLIVGEGCGMVVLKRLSDAVVHGDEVIAVIRGIGLSNDTAGSLLAADSAGQLRAMRTAYKNAGWRPSDVDIIECHGTGTPLGDAAEFASLRELWRNEPRQQNKTPIGSIKSMVGHLLTAAGIAGLHKILLGMQHGQLPPSANFATANPKLAIAESPFTVQSNPSPWSHKEKRTRRAAISSFGFGGINAHLLVEQFDAPQHHSEIDNEIRVTRNAVPTDQKKQPKRETEHQKHEPIAIVGIGASIGNSTSLTDFARHGFGNREAANRLCRRIDELNIPIGKFKLPPNEITQTLPQQLLMLQVAAAALNDAGLPLHAERERMGVLIGAALDLNTSNYHLRWTMLENARRWNREWNLGLTADQLDDWVAQLRAATGPALNAPRVLGSLGGIIASRIARELGCGGPSFVLSSGAQSGIDALDFAVTALRNRELDTAVLGAVDLCNDMRLRSLRREAEPQSDAGVAFVLKRLRDAERDGDHIYSVVREVRFDSETERDAARAQENRRHFNATHATVANAGAATSLVHVLEAALHLDQRRSPQENETASSHGHWHHNRADGPRGLTVQVASDPLAPSAAVLLEEHEATAPDNAISATVQSIALPAPFAIFGESRKEIAAGIEKLRQFVAQHSSSNNLYELAIRWNKTVSEGDSASLALTIVANAVPTIHDALNTARDLLANEVAAQHAAAQNVFFTTDSKTTASKLAFVYPGSGNQYDNMGHGLAAGWPQVMNEEAAATAQLARELNAGNATPRDVILSTVSYGMLATRLLQSLGVQPDAALGYSVGETTSLLAIGVWKNRDDMRERLLGSTLFESDLAGPCHAARSAWNLKPDQAFVWRTTIVRSLPDAVREALRNQERVRLLIINTSNECVIGGSADAVQRVVDQLDCDAIDVGGVSTVHCDVVREVEKAYLDLHRLRTSKVPDIAFYSTARARQYQPTREAAAKSITAQAINGFDFSKLVEQAYANGVRTFIEVGPGNSCTRMIREILHDQPHTALAIANSADREAEGIVRTIAALVAQGAIPNLDGFFAQFAALAKQQIDLQHDSNRECVNIKIQDPEFDPPLPPRATPKTSATARFDETPPRTMTETPPYFDHPQWTSQPLATHVAADIATAGAATAVAHQRFLAQSQQALRDIAAGFAAQTQLLNNNLGAAAPVIPGNANQEQRLTQPQTNVVFDRNQCLEFAIGKIANVLGPQFAAVDGYPVRVRLPDEPLMLVDRITHLEAEPNSLSHGRIVTEHDVHRDAWYLDNDRAPVCITVESGQADLFLCSYLGIDLAVRGTRAYRLLDATIELHRGLPRGGDLIQYDIRIEKFVRQGSAYLFFFNFTGTIGGRPLITMTNGCAGFFTDAEIENSGGIVEAQKFTVTSNESREQRLKDHPALFAPASIQKQQAPSKAEQYSESEIDELRNGSLAACFGAEFALDAIQNPIRIPSGRMRLLHRITELDIAGGPHGLGRVIAEADIHPDDWFLTCHFVDDMVMPGTLMYECCAHTLRVLLTRFGWVGEHTDVAYEPVVGVPAKLKCRGPVTPQTKIVTYQVDIKEVGFNPAPYVIADALMCADGRPVVTFTDMSMQLTGLTKATIESLWNPQATNAQSQTNRAVPMAIGIKKQTDETTQDDKAIVPIGETPIPTTAKPGIFEKRHIMAFSNGKPSEAFGEPYRCFDDERRIARLPGPPYQFLDRITEIQGPEAFVCQPGGWIDAQYDVPQDEWYFAANRQSSMPFAVLLEIALQPCGWLAAYVGSALTSDRDLSFRNLGGTATQYAELFPDCGTLTIRVRLTDVSKAAGMIIQKFDMQVWQAGRIIYDGDTSFGFFTAAALSNQVGIRDAADRAKKMRETNQTPCTVSNDGSPIRTPCAKQGAGTLDIEKTITLRQSDASIADDLSLPARDWLMLDAIEHYEPTGGPANLGYIRGIKDVDPSEWFFAAHFYQDPVIPGSLGLESMLQLLKYFAIQKWGDEYATSHRFAPLLNEPHEWIYRGQVIPKNKRVTVETAIKEIRDGNEPTIIADGFLSVDGLYIYEMKDFAIRVVKR